MSLRGAARGATRISGASAAAATRREETGRARQRVEDDAPRLTVDVGDARGQLRIVQQGGPRSPPQRRPPKSLSPAVRELAAARARAADPVRVPRTRRHLPIQRHRRLEQDPRAPGARVLAKRLVEQARGSGDRAVGHDDLHAALAAQDAEAPPGRLLRRVVERHPRRGAAPRQGSRPYTGGVWPWWQQGSSVTYKRRAAQVRARARLERVDLRMRPAELPVPALTEHSSSRTTTAPTSGLG